MAETLPSGAERITQWFSISPFGRHVGLRLTRLDKDLAEVVMPFQACLPTLGDVVHGGAISTLIDTAATVAAWSGAEAPEGLRGATIALTVNFVGAGRGRDLTATARIVRRGRSVCFCDVDVTDSDGGLVAKGLVTYKLG